MTVETEVVIIGAGPYGLSVAGHLKAGGVSFRIFGSPMRFWRDMPHSMYLKSFAYATSVYTPANYIGFEKYSAEHNLETDEPCAIVDFASYGEYVQKLNIPELEEVDVAAVQARADHFLVTLENGATVTARNVVVATGLKAFWRVPRELEGLPPSLVSHTSAHNSVDHFRDKTVFVIGAGQSALQACALLHEAGSRVELFVRGGSIRFSNRMKQNRSLFERIRNPRGKLGVGLKTWIIATFPFIVFYVPDRWRVPFVKSYLGPNVAWWLRERVTDKFPIHLNTAVEAARDESGALEVRLRNRATGAVDVRQCDHLISGTGFEIDIDRLDFLAPDLRAKIARIERSVRLDRHFQSSVRGLYFVGTASAMSFGPLFRFVSGAEYTSKVILAHLRHVARRGSARLAAAAAPSAPLTTRDQLQTQRSE